MTALICLMDIIKAVVRNDPASIAADLKRLHRHLTKAVRYAAQNGQPECLDLLIKFGINVNDTSSGDAAIIRAAFNDHVECMNMLISAGANVNIRSTDGTTALHAAAEMGSIYTLRRLLACHGIDVNARNYRHGQTALMRATMRGNYSCVALLLQANGVDVNARDLEGSTALMNAIAGEFVECTNLLLSLSNIDVSAIDMRGKTALFYSVENVCDAATHRLLKINGIRMDMTDSVGYSLLDVACDAGDPEVVYTMLQNGATIATTPYTNRTPLMVMASMGKPEMVDYLIQRGVSLTVCDVTHRNALYFAAVNRHFNILIALIKALRECDKDNEGMMLIFHRAAKMRHIFACLPLLLRGKIFRWEWYAGLYQPAIPKMLRRIVISGTPPGQFVYKKHLCTPLYHAFLIKHEGLIRYILANLYLTPRDLHLFRSDETLRRHVEGCGSIGIQQLYRRMRQAVWRLETLALLTISVQMRNDDNRHEIVRKSKMAKELSDKNLFQLAFRTDLRATPVSQWNEIELDNIFCREPTDPNENAEEQQMEPADLQASAATLNGGGEEDGATDNEIENEDDDDDGWETVDEDEDDEIVFEEQDIEDEDDAIELAAEDSGDDALMQDGGVTEHDYHDWLDSIDYLVSSNDNDVFQPLPSSRRPLRF